MLIIAPSEKSTDLTVIRGQIVDPGLLVISSSTQIILLREFYLSMTIERKNAYSFPLPI